MKRRKRMNKIIQLGNLRKDTKNFTNPQTGRIYSAEGIVPTLNTCQGVIDNRLLLKGRYMKKIPCEYRTDEGYRLFKGNVCGTIRTIECGGIKELSKFMISRIIF